MGSSFGYNGKSGPLSDEGRQAVKEQHEKLGAEAVEFWRTEKESARLWVLGGRSPRRTTRLKKKS